MDAQALILDRQHSQQRTGTRWGILLILFIVTTINYADRASISIAGPELSKSLGLSTMQMGFIFSAFAWSYVLAQIPGGWRGRGTIVSW